MKCVNCHFLCTADMDVLPEYKREQLRLNIPDSIELVCSKSMESFGTDESETYEKTLKGRRCTGFIPVDYTRSTQDMLHWQLRDVPAWQGYALIIGTLLIAGSIIAAVLLLLLD